MERFKKLFTPKNYQLKLSIDKEKEILSGICVVTGRPEGERLKFHAVEMQIDRVAVGDEDCDYKYDGEVLEVGVGERGEEVAITVVYHKPLNKNMQGAYLSTYRYQGKTEKVVATQFESHYARECFPCVDEPAAKATFEIEVTSSDPDDTILANTEAVETTLTDMGKTVVFRATPKMSTYLVAFVVGKFHHCAPKTTNSGTVVTTYCPLNHPVSSTEFANQVAVDCLNYYDENFKVPFPLKKLDQIALPDFEAGAMENWGLVTYREACLLADKNTTADTKQAHALTIAHELSHQWFGDLVTMEWWDELWLNESFASVIEYFAIDHIHPEYKVWQEFFTGNCLIALRRDALPGVQAVQQPVQHPAEIATLFDHAIVYAKGSHLMLMLFRLIGQENFYRGLRDYFEKFQYKNTTGDDLWNALQPYADFNVKDFMHAWISQPGYPVITGDTQTRFLLTGDTDDTVWPLPEVKDDMSGHYLIRLSDDDYRKAVEGFEELSLEQQLRLTIDRLLLAKTDLVPAASLLDLLPKLKTSKAAPVWEMAAMIIHSLKLFCPPRTEAYRDLRRFLTDCYAEVFEKLLAGDGADFPAFLPVEGESNNDTRLRDIVLSIATVAKYRPVLEKLAALYDEDPAKLNPELRTHILAAKRRLDEDGVFDNLVKQYRLATDPEIKSDLMLTFAAAKHEGNVEKLLALLEDSETIRPQDHLHFFVHLRHNYYAKQPAFEWLTTHWDYVKSLSAEKAIEDYPRYIANTIYTPEEAERFRDFFGPLKAVPVLARTIDVAEAEIAATLALIARDAPGVREALRG